jgi:prepilin-type N-terminal cleavage/methylation domain-containing protein
MKLSRPPRPRGFSLIEILFVLVLLGVMLSLATPAMSGWLARTRLDSLTSQLSTDLFYARMLAVRAGHRVEVVVEPNKADECIAEYAILIHADPPRTAKRVDVRASAPGVCLTMNQNGMALAFNSRGVPTPMVNRTFRAQAGALRSELSIASGGRVRREY